MNRLVQLTLFVMCFLSVSLRAQLGEGYVRGKIRGEGVKKLSGITIKDRQSGNKTVSNAKGEYSLTLTTGKHTLIIEGEGYESTTDDVDIPEGTTIIRDYTLTPSAESMGEVVIVGYGTSTRKELTGSVSSLKGKDIVDMPAPSFEAAMQGKAAGVQVTMGSGVAGSASLVRVRGVASISAAGDPLYIVDGIPITQDYFINGNNGGFNNNPLATLNPNDIESIEILKDAAATAIYGSRGSNGVILISTKRAKKSGLKFNFTSRIGTAQATFTPRMLNSSQFLQMYQEAWENDGGVGLAPLPNNISWEDARKTNTNWVDETMGTGMKQLYSLGTTYRKGNSAHI